MITSISKELSNINIPILDDRIKMLPFNLDSLNGVPYQFKQLVDDMVNTLPIKEGIAYLTIDGRVIEKGKSHRRGGVHIDGNYIPELSDWTSGGWKVGEGGRILSSEHHKLSYESKTGGMLIASNYSACKGWAGIFEGNPDVGGDCSKIKGLSEGFMLKPNVVYYGNSQFLHESLPINESIHRTIVRITLPIEYPVL